MHTFHISQTALLALFKDAFFVLALAPAVVLLIFALSVIYNLYFHTLHSHPGLLLARSSRLWWLYHSLKGDLHRQLVLLHRRYGQTVRIAPDEISYTHPEAWSEIHAARPGQLAYERETRDFVNNVPDILSSERVRHARTRRLFAHGFADKAIQEQDPVVQRYIDEFVKQLGKRCENGENVVDMSLWFNLVTFDAIGCLVFGEDFGSLQSEQLDPYIAVIFQGVKYISIIRSLNRIPGLMALQRKLLPLAMTLREFFVPRKVRESHRKQMRRTRDMVDRRRKKTPAYTDLLANFIHATTTGEFSLAELYQNSDLLLLAGSETTSSCLSGTVYYLTTHLSIQQILATEVRSAFSSPTEINMRSVTQRCPYLLAVLSESLRLYPPTPTLLHRVVRAEGDMIAGRFVPGGTTVGVNQLAMNRDPANFARADEFAPERWMPGADRERGDFVGDRREAFQPFGAGPRNCIGRNLAYLETRTILAKLVWEFDLELRPESRGWVDGQDTFMGWQKGPLMVRLTPSGLLREAGGSD